MQASDSVIALMAILELYEIVMPEFVVFRKRLAEVFTAGQCRIRGFSTARGGLPRPARGRPTGRALEGTVTPGVGYPGRFHRGKWSRLELARRSTEPPARRSLSWPPRALSNSWRSLRTSHYARLGERRRSGVVRPAARRKCRPRLCTVSLRPPSWIASAQFRVVLAINTSGLTRAPPGSRRPKKALYGPRAHAPTRQEFWPACRSPCARRSGALALAR